MSRKKAPTQFRQGDVLITRVEPDGSIKEYWLRVPTPVATALAAVAWTFGLEREQDYAPAIET
jgi:hypothetical protein